jgi:hypothetical protein
MNLNRSSINYVWAQLNKNAPVSIGHWSLITFECTESTSTPAGIPKNGPSVYFSIFISGSAKGLASSASTLHSSIPTVPTIVSGRQSLLIHHSVIHFNHEVYCAIWESMLGTWVDTWIWRDFITQLGNCNSITNQPQRSYKWEC